MNFSRRFRSTRPASTNNQALATLKKIQDCVPYLEKRKEILLTDNNCFHNEDLNQINYWLGIAKDVEADLTYEMQTLEAIYDQITEMAREFPVEWDDDDDESEAEEEDEEEILGLAKQMNRPAAPPLSPPVAGILIPGGRGRGVHGRTNNSALTQTPPETQPGSSPPTFIRIPNGYSVGRGRGKRLEANQNPPPQPGPNSSNGHDNNSTNYLPKHIEHQRSGSESMQFQSRTSPQKFSSRSENVLRSPTGAHVSPVKYSDRRVIDYGHQIPANSADFDVFSKENNVEFNENCAPDSRFSGGSDTVNGSTNFGASGSNVAQDAVNSNPMQQFHQNRPQVYAPNNHPGPSHQFQQNNLQNSQFNHHIRPPYPLSIPRSSLLGNPGPSVFSNPRIPHFRNIHAPQIPLPPHVPCQPFPLLYQTPPLIGHMPSSSTWIPNRHQNFNPNQRGFGPRMPSNPIRPHFNPNARGALQPKTRIQVRFDSISRTDISTNQTQRPPGGNLASSPASKPPDTNSIDWRSRVNDYFSQQQQKQRPTNGIRLTNPHQARHRGRGRGNSRGGPAARGRRPPSQAKNLLNNSNNEPQRNEEDSKETEKSTSPPSAKKRQAAVQTSEDREKSRVLNRVRANLERELPQRSKESKLAQMRKEFSQNEVYRLGFKNKDNTIQKGPVEKLPEPQDEDSPTKNVSRSRSRSVPRARSRSKSAAKDSRDQSGSLSPKKKPSRRVDDEDTENQDREDRNEVNEEDDRDEQISYEDQEDDTERQGGNSDAENDSQDMTENNQSKVPQVSDESHFIALARSLLVETGVSEEDIENVLSNPNQKKEILNAIQEALARPNQNVSQSQQELEVNSVMTQPPPRPESTSSSAASTISESSTSSDGNSSTKKRKKADQSRTNDITEDSSAPSPPPKSPPPKKRSQSSAPTKPAKNTTKGRSGRQEIHFIKAPELPIHVGMTKIKIEQDYVAEQRIKQEPVHPDQNCDDSD